MYVTPDDLYPNYLEYTTIFPKKVDEWEFPFVTLYMN